MFVVCTRAWGSGAPNVWGVTTESDFDDTVLEMLPSEHSRSFLSHTWVGPSEALASEKERSGHSACFSPEVAFFVRAESHAQVAPEALPV